MINILTFLHTFIFLRIETNVYLLYLFTRLKKNAPMVRTVFFIYHPYFSKLLFFFIKLFYRKSCNNSSSSSFITAGICSIRGILFSRLKIENLLRSTMVLEIFSNRVSFNSNIWNELDASDITRAFTLEEITVQFSKLFFSV